MKATSLRTGLIGAVALWALSGLAPVLAKESDKPPFYEFSHKGKTVYLLGSIHVGSADFYPMPKVVESAFNSAEALVVEADIGAAGADIQRLLMTYGVDASSPDAESAAVLEQYCSSRKPICEAMAPFSPWMQASQITVMQFAGLGYQPEFGVDQHFLDRARGSKAIFELEGMEYQFKLMASLDKSQQWAMVREAIVASDEEVGALVNSWRGGDSDELAAVMHDSMAEGDDTQLLKLLLWDRNHRMADTLQSLLTRADTPKTLMVVVGAGHLVGEQSLVSILAERGIKVKGHLGHCAATQGLCQ
ncbi:TraB/GumN family protein [Shewanella litorisediminis]|uniref:TraB/GumN family protein n=1 Tax=Shewanella litorisediminis TaxID=1173586 RepID=A0ABX7G207_9GAMM|nr:TraB/GumN family protein [Shewanella litorisediminis]MCL2918532.1 TraB/GumN family protein [Shewanella litorisediminis]QRH01359.1 TraB/GumN family protein [Shewanella litorisediminis]